MIWHKMVLYNANNSMYGNVGVYKFLSYEGGCCSEGILEKTTDNEKRTDLRRKF